MIKTITEAINRGLGQIHFAGTTHTLILTSTLCSLSLTAGLKLAGSNSLLIVEEGLFNPEETFHTPEIVS